jgi:hypothetical protein
MSVTADMLRFDEAEHRYYLGNRELPSVTGILKAAGLVDDRFYTEESRLRGTYVHTACCLLDEDDLEIESLDEVLRPYVEAYAAFKSVARPTWQFVEHRVCDDVHGYAGTLDRAGIVNGKPLLIDIKTGTVPPWVALQTAAYRRCLPGGHTYRRAALHLKADATFNLIELPDRHDEAVFLGALGVVQWKQRMGWS